MAGRVNPKTAKGGKQSSENHRSTWRLIGEIGSNSVTLDQIAGDCGISKSSILWYFGSKESLLLEVADGVFRDLEKTFIEQCPPHLSPSERFEFFLDNYEEMLKAHPQAPNIFFSFAFNHAFQEKIYDKIREIYEWNREAFCEQFGLTENQAVILLGALHGVVIQADFHPERITIHEVFAEFKSLVKKIL